MIEDVALRALRHADVARLVELERRCFSSPWPPEPFAHAVSQPSSLALGAWHGDELIGYVIAVVRGRLLLIANLAVATEERRRGLGSTLLEAALRRGADAGARVATLDVRASNHAARELYRSLGFEIIGQRSGYYVDPPEDAVTMGRALLSRRSEGRRSTGAGSRTSRRAP